MNFGDDLRLREDAREMWGSTWLDRLHQDLTYGARVLRNAPAFTFTAMLVLVLGIGVPLSAFRVVLTDLQGGSVPDPDSLVRLTRRAPDAHVTSLTYPELTFYAANAKSFRSVIGVSTRNPATFGEAADGSTPESIHLTFVTANYFPEFGIVPALGRVLTADDERADAEPAAVIESSRTAAALRSWSVRRARPACTLSARTDQTCARFTVHSPAAEYRWRGRPTGRRSFSRSSMSARSGRRRGSLPMEALRNRTRWISRGCPDRWRFRRFNRKPQTR